MRWSGQAVSADDAAALPALARRADLVRSVQTPEFAGITFHEVLAKSALNHVPGAGSALPFGWTINPYRGCSHACTFCLDPETLVLTGEGRQVPIWSLRVGDEVIGTEKRGSYRRFVTTTVEAWWQTRKHAYRIELADGTEIVASGDHRFLTERGWKHVRGAMSGPSARPFLTLNNRLMGFGLSGVVQESQPPLADPAYARGYLTGMIRGDGSIFHGRYPSRSGRGGTEIHAFRLALADGEALNRARYYLAASGVETRTRPFLTATRRHRAMTAIHTARREDVARIEEIIAWPERDDGAWHRGYLSGLFDAEGSCSRGVLRISNKDAHLLATANAALARVGVEGVLEPPSAAGVRSLRVVGGLPARERFFREVAPAITRKLDVTGSAVKTFADLRIVAIEDLGTEVDMIDITTGTGDFVANGVISHNCFARPTHEYLDFDAGRDFDTQIVVKVNVGEVLERELARPSWARAHVALGTNTDPYQRAEGRYRLMPGVIAALAASGTPFSILTKGTLLRRDLPLLQAAAERVPVQVAMTVAVFDAELAGSVESGAPTAEARLATVRAAREAGFAPTVFLMPVLPFLTDSAGQLDRALARIAEAGAASVAYSALHLRPGAKEWFFGWLERERPELVPRYRQLYAESAYAPGEYRRALAARIRPLLRRHGLDRPAVDPSTGIAASPELATGSRFSAVASTALGAASPRTADGVGALAAELSPAAAAALQPTLF